MANLYYGVTGNPVSQSRGASSTTRAEFTLIQQGFDKLSTPAAGAGSNQNYAVDTGAVNALISVVNSNVVALTDGLEFVVKVAVANTGATTFTAGALGTKAIVRGDNTALQANDILAGEIVELRYNITNDNFQLLQVSAGSAASASASAAAAAASAAQALAAATSLTSTSTTSLSVSIASKSFTTQTGKAYVAGYQFITLVSAASPTQWMLGLVTAYTSGTGAMTVNVTAIGAAGTNADWNVAVSGSQGPIGVAATTTRQTLTDAATINWDWSLGRLAVVTLAGNRTIAAPTNLVTDTCIFEVVQDATGSRTLTWNAIFLWPEGALPTLSTVASRRDLCSGYYNGTNIIMSFLRGVR